MNSSMYGKLAARHTTGDNEDENDEQPFHINLHFSLPLTSFRRFRTMTTLK